MRLITAVAVTFVLSAIGRAEGLKPLNEVSINTGGFFPLTRVSVQGGGTDDLAGPGFMVGADYFRNLTDDFSMGFEIDSINAGQHNSTSIFPHLFITSQFSSLAEFILLRVSKTVGTISMYGVAGLGAHTTTIKADAFPVAGFSWSDTGTGESRSLINTTAKGAAACLQFGLDSYLRENLSLGASARYYYLGSSMYGAAPAAQKMGLQSLGTSISGFSLTATLGYHF